MPQLILDTSTELCLLAIIDGIHLLDQCIFPHHNSLAKSLLPTLHHFLEQNALTPKSLHTIAIGAGPGSYTGTRLGAAVAKSLAFGLKIPLKTFPSPLAFLPMHMGSFAFLIPTRSGAFFTLKGTSSPTGIQQINTALLTPQELAQETADVDFFVGYPSELFPSKKTFYTPAPNVHFLSLFLEEKEPDSLENAELLYLHTPF
jgi:tRNA threonylcarbamoyl adenosine modification protein YeaZ